MKKQLPLFLILAALFVALIVALVTVGCESGKQPASPSETSSEAVSQTETEEPSSEEPTPAPTPTPTEAPSEAEPTPTPTPTPAPTATPEPTATPKPQSGDELSALHATTKGSGKYPYYLNVNLNQNIVTVYTQDENGYYTVPDRCFVCSAGGYREDGTCKTPSGTYRTMSQTTGWATLYGHTAGTYLYWQYATRITGHILFHSVPYTKKNKSSLEWEEYNRLGTNASAGCIRLAVSDVKWIFDKCPVGTTVTMYESDLPEPLAKPTPFHIAEDTPDELKGWDPTDPDVKNPWLGGEEEEE